MSEQNSFETTEYTLKDLSAEELKALIDQFPGGDDADYAFLAALLDEYASRPESPQVDAESAKVRCMDSLGLLPDKAKHHSSPHRPIRIAIAAAAAVAVLAGSALAIGLHTDFFRNIFGVSSAVETPVTTEPVTVAPSEYSYIDREKDEVISYTLPGYQLVEIDEAEADRLLGPYVTELNDVYTYGDYTLTILGYIEDEAGTYRVYYSIENPNGLDNINLYEYNGRMYIDYPDGAELRVLADSSWVTVDTERSTETKVFACVPGVVLPWVEHGAELRLYDNADKIETITVTSDKIAPVVVLENADYRVYVSAMGAKVLALNQPEGLGFQLDENFSISLNDGTEFVVYQSGVMDNTTYKSSGGDVEDSESFCFNRLIDPAAETGVVVDGATITVG